MGSIDIVGEVVTATQSTRTEPPGFLGWPFDDAVVQLRERGTGRVYTLPDPPRACMLGTMSELQLIDVTGTVSRAHAEAAPVEVGAGRVWRLRDLQSKNGLRFEGIPCESGFLRPGTEVSLGSLRLIAESEQLMLLFTWLQRLLGWALDRQAYIDQVGQGLHYWAARRAELVIVGDGDLVPEVRRLHRSVIGEGVSLTYEPNGDDGAAVVRAIRVAVGGTLCVQVKRREEARLVVEHWLERRPSDRPRLIFCTADPAVGATILRTLGGLLVIVRVPPVASRLGERDALVQAYVGEVVHDLGLSEPGLTAHDMERLRVLPFHSLAEIEETALRLITLRRWGLPDAAKRLGLVPTVLRTWAALRGLELMTSRGA